MDAATVRPFLKWAGGKRQLLPVLRRFYPARFHGYHEPFLGSGAVFFDLMNRGRLPAERVRLTDMNTDLIGCCLRLRDAVDGVVAALRRLDTARRRDPEAHYYRVRDREFNPGRAAIMNGSAPRPDAYTPELAAMLIYLNRTGYNGLFRLNAKGTFNVPRGRYANPRVCDEANLRAVAAAFDDAGATIDHAPYDALLQHAQAEDFIYLDPPYAPLSRTAHFTSYNGRRLLERRSAPPAAGGDGAGRPRMLRAAQQLDGGGGATALRRQPGCRTRRHPGAPRAGAARDQFERCGAERRDGIRHHEHRGRDGDGDHPGIRTRASRRRSRRRPRRASCRIRRRWTGGSATLPIALPRSRTSRSRRCSDRSTVSTPTPRTTWWRPVTPDTRASACPSTRSTATRASRPPRC